MNPPELSLVIKPAEESQLDLLEEVFSPTNMTLMYLIAPIWKQV
jgi:hypothetical protein